MILIVISKANGSRRISARKKTSQSSLQQCRIERLAFPNNQYCVAFSTEFLHNFNVPGTVPCDLLQPSQSVSSWDCCSRATAMAMPKTTVHQNRPLVGLVTEVGRTWQRSNICPEANTAFAQDGAHSLLRTSSGLLYALHALGSLSISPPFSHRLGHRTSQFGTQSWIRRNG